MAVYTVHNFQSIFYIFTSKEGKINQILFCLNEMKLEKSDIPGDLNIFQQRDVSGTQGLKGNIWSSFEVSKSHK